MRLAALLVSLATVAAVAVAAPPAPLAPEAPKQKPKPPTPCAFIVVIDRSLPAEELESVRQGVADAAAGLIAGDRIAVVAFGEKAQVLAPFQPGGRRGPIAAALAGLSRAEQGNQHAGLAAADKLLEDSQIPRPLRVVLVTNSSALMATAEIRGQLASHHVLLSAIGVNSTNRIALQKLASGGRSEVVVDAASLARNLVQEARAPTWPEPQPIALVLVLDRSSAMQGKPLEQSREAARTLLEVLAPDDLFTLVTYDSTAELQLRPQRAAGKAQLSAVLSRITAGGRRTTAGLVAALEEARAVLETVAMPDKRVIVITSGAVPSDELPAQVKRMAGQRIDIAVVGVDGARPQSLSHFGDEVRLFMMDDSGRVRFDHLLRSPAP